MTLWQVREFCRRKDLNMFKTENLSRVLWRLVRDTCESSQQSRHGCRTTDSRPICIPVSRLSHAGETGA